MNFYTDAEEPENQVEGKSARKEASNTAFIDFSHRQSTYTYTNSPPTVNNVNPTACRETLGKTRDTGRESSRRETNSHKCRKTASLLFIINYTWLIQSSDRSARRKLPTNLSQGVWMGRKLFFFSHLSAFGPSLTVPSSTLFLFA